MLKCPYHPEGGPLSSGGKGQCAPEHDPIEERLGEAEYHRVWCSAASFLLNDFRKVEFCGWVIGWGETVLEPRTETFPVEARPVEVARTEATVYLTTDRMIVTAIDLVPEGALEHTGSPPDQWATFVGQHSGMDAATRWAHAVGAIFSPTLGWRGVNEALDQAETAIANLSSEVAALDV
jgi:hypothetical protein